jgi:hypothetical protein
MTWGDLAVGELDDPDFHWDGGDYNGNLPRPLLNLGNLELFGIVQARSLLEERYGGKVLDWGGSGAPLKRERILEFLREFQMRSISEEWRRKATQKVMTLNPDKVYLLYDYVYES